MGREDDHLSGPSFGRDSMGGEPLFYQDLTTFDANRSTACGACGIADDQSSPHSRLFAGADLRRSVFGPPSTLSTLLAVGPSTWRLLDFGHCFLCICCS